MRNDTFVKCWEEHVRMKPPDAENKPASSQLLDWLVGAERVEQKGPPTLLRPLRAQRPQPAWHLGMRLPSIHKPQAGSCCNSVLTLPQHALHCGLPSSWAVRRERRGGGQGQAWAEGPSLPKGQQQSKEWPSSESWDRRRDHESCPMSSGLPCRWAP